MAYSEDLAETLLFDRSVATLVQSWAYLATGSPGTEVIETDGAATAIFVHSPDREFLNNTILTRRIGNLGPTLDAVERAYADRGVERYAIWVAEARERGCTTVSLQSTPMAEGVYAGVGFRDLGRFDEYVAAATVPGS